MVFGEKQLAGIWKPTICSQQFSLMALKYSSLRKISVKSQHRQDWGWVETHTNTNTQIKTVMEREQKRLMELIHVTYSGWIFLTCCSLSPCVLLLRNVLMSLTFIIIEFSGNGRRRVCVCGECCFDERELLWVSLAWVLAQGWIIEGVCF